MHSKFGWKTGLPDFFLFGEIYQTIWVQNYQNAHKIPSGGKILQLTVIYNSIFPSKVLRNVYTPIGIFGLKRNHLATLTEKGKLKITSDRFENTSYGGHRARVAR
jgi:hypothetical protein